MLTATLLSLSLLHAQHQSIDFARTWKATQQAIERSYYGRISRKREMEDRLREYGPKASSATSKGEFRDIVDRMIAEFHDSHFDFLTDEDQGYYLMDSLARRENAVSMPEIGAWFKKGDDGYTVMMVMEEGEAARVGLQKGDLMISIEGKPFSPVLGFKDYVGKHAHIRFKHGRSEREADVEVNDNTAVGMFLAGTKNSIRVIPTGGKKIGYIHLWTQAADSFKEALASAVYGKLVDTDAMILDLRDGFGGRPEGYGDPFFRPDMSVEWRQANGGFKQQFGYGKPLVILINGGSRSAKEVLSYAMKKSKRAILIGSNTAGNVLGTVPSKLNDWAYLEIPTVEVYTDGVRLEGKGVAPDIAVAKEFDDSGKDLYIEAALRYLTFKRG